MEGEEEGVRMVTGRCPRCELCGVVVRVRGVGREGVWCAGCMGRALPFVGLVGEGEFRGALREYREGLGSRAGEFEGLRFDPFDEEVRGALGGLDATLRGCGYVGGDEVGGGLGRLQGRVAVPYPSSFTMSGVLGGRVWRCLRQS